MDFELKKAKEKWEREQKQRKAEAKARVDRERKAREEAARLREALETAQRQRRVEEAQAAAQVSNPFIRFVRLFTHLIKNVWMSICFEIRLWLFLFRN